MPFASVFTKNHYTIILISLLLVALSFVDNVIGFSFLDTYEERSSLTLMSFLTTIFIVNVAGQYVLILSVLKLSFSTFRLRPANIISPHISMLILVTINAVIFLSLIGVAFQTQKYNLDALKFLIAYNLLISIGIIGILAYKILSWLMKYQNPSILLYSAAFGVFCVVGISALAVMLLELEGRPSSISPEPNPWDRTSTRKLLVTDIYSISFLAMFVIVWLATSLLLRSYVVNYVKRIGKKMFWILVSLPLAYYIISSDSVLNQFIPIIFDYPYLANLITYSFGAAKQVGGVFFAISFIFMLKKAAGKQLKITLALSAAGIMMLFSSIQITILQLIPYPPFGLSTLSTMPIASYLLLVGLYYSAKSISYDTQLLHSLKKRVRDEPSAFLGGIGSAEWQQNIENTVQNIMEKSKKPEEDLGSDLSQDDVKSYLSQVVKEVEDYKRQPKK